MLFLRYVVEESPVVVRGGAPMELYRRTGTLLKSDKELLETGEMQYCGVVETIDKETGELQIAQVYGGPIFGAEKLEVKVDESAGSLAEIQLGDFVEVLLDNQVNVKKIARWGDNRSYGFVGVDSVIPVGDMVIVEGTNGFLYTINTQTQFHQISYGKFKGMDVGMKDLDEAKSLFITVSSVKYANNKAIVAVADVWVVG